MSSLNKVMLIGNLGKDPEMRTTSSGKAVTNFTMATQNGFGENATPEWHTVTLWEKKAEAAAKYLKKGSKVYVEGRIQTRKYEDKEGVTKYATEIQAYDFQFLDSKAKDAVGEAHDEF